MGVKEDAMKERRPEDKVMYTENFSKYSFCKNYDELMRIIKEKKVPRICEYVFEALPVNFFYDIDIKETANPKEFEDYKKIVHDIIDKTTAFFEDRGISVRVIVLKSHTSKKAAEQKKSFHIIFRIPNCVFTIPCCISIANFLWKEVSYLKKGIIDKSVFREGNFRSYLCSKKDEVRPFLRCKSFGSQGFDDVDTFVQYYSDDANVLTEEELGIEVNHEKGNKTEVARVKRPSPLVPVDEQIPILLQFILENFPISPSEISYKKEKNMVFTFQLTSKYCPFQKREHRSNHQFLTVSSKLTAQKCHDPDCQGLKEGKILAANYPASVKAIFGNNEAIEYGEEECRDLVLKTWGVPVEKKFKYDMTTREFVAEATKEMGKYFSGRKGCCKSPCIIYHKVNSDGYLMECRSCKNRFPMMPITIPPSYGNITLNVTLNQVINNYNCHPSTSNIELNPRIFDDDHVTSVMNRVLSSHIRSTSRFLKETVSGFVYSNDKKPLFYYFNGTIWKEDKDNMKLREKLTTFDQYFIKVKSFYQNLPPSEMGKSILDATNRIFVKFEDPRYLGSIVDSSKDFYHIPNFTENLDTNPRFLAFENGVFDLAKNEFRAATMEDNLSFTVGYDYDPNAETDFLWDFLRKILPKPHLLDYMLKRLADCLDASIPNTIFLIITGDGANGKSQLFNLMEATLGDGYARKIAVTLLTRKRENANDTNSEMMDMKGKRFIFFSEPESGEKFNISCLKDLTGSEKVKATAKYEGASSFNIDAKMFIGCNEVPELKAEDKATWRRVRLLEFKSNFVDDPNPDIPNQYAKDDSIPDKIKDDVTWRKALMKILLDYYYRRDIVEPIEVKRQTEALREENNEMEAWCRDNIEIDPEFEAKQRCSPKMHSHWLVKDEVKRELSLKKLKDVDQIVIPFIRKFMPQIDAVYKQQAFCTPSGERKLAFRCWLGIRLKKQEYV